MVYKKGVYLMSSNQEQICIICSEVMSYQYSEGEFPDTEHHYACPCGVTLIICDDNSPNIWHMWGGLSEV